MKILVTVLSFWLATPVFAQHAQTIDLSQRFQVRDSETISVRLQKPAYVRNLIVQARGVSAASTVEVMVNGQVKGTIYAPGQDPSYVVTVEAAASSVEFRHRYGGTMEILNVKAVTFPTNEFPRPHPHRPQTPADAVQALARDVIHLVGDLQSYADYTTEKDYLQPIKRKAGEVLVMNGAHGALSIHTRRALQDLQKQIELADPYIEDILNRNALFELGIELLTIKEGIRDWLD